MAQNEGERQNLLPCCICISLHIPCSWIIYIIRHICLAVKIKIASWLLGCLDKNIQRCTYLRDNSVCLECLKFLVFWICFPVYAYNSWIMLAKFCFKDEIVLFFLKNVGEPIWLVSIPHILLDVIFIFSLLILINIKGGGSLLSRQEREEVRAEADAEFQGEERLLKKNKRQKGNQRRSQVAEDELGSLFGDAFMGKLPKLANRITLKVFFFYYISIHYFLKIFILMVTTKS